MGATEGEPTGFFDGDEVGLQISGIKRQMVGFIVGRESDGSLVGASVSTPDGGLDSADGAPVGTQSSGNNTQIVGEGTGGLGAVGVGRFEGATVRSRERVGAPVSEGTGVGGTVNVGTGVSVGVEENPIVGDVVGVQASGSNRQRVGDGRGGAVATGSEGLGSVGLAVGGGRAIGAGVRSRVGVGS